MNQSAVHTVFFLKRDSVTCLTTMWTENCDDIKQKLNHSESHTAASMVCGCKFCVKREKPYCHFR